MDRGWPQNFERKIAIRSKTHRRKAALLKQNNKELRKRNIAFRDTIQALSVYYKRSFNEKSVISYKTNHYFAKVLKNHLTLGSAKNFFRPLGPHFGQKRRGGGAGPPGPLPWICHCLSPECLICCSISTRFCLH